MEKLKVLIVDDMRTSRLHLKLMLRARAFEIEEAEDGVEALVKIRTDRPHLVLMDIMMPRMDGIECCRRIKSDSELCETKVVIISSEEEFQKVDEAFKAGCDDYVVKPVKEEELFTKIDELCAFVMYLDQLRK